MNNLNSNIIDINNLSNETKITEIDEESAKMKVLAMHLLDQTFYHFNCKDNISFNINNLSSELIIAIHTILTDQNIKTYENQYYIDSCKKELFSKDDDQFNQIVKNSKIFETKEYTQWDWKSIDNILDVIDTCREYIPELHKKKFFKNLLFIFMPSKNIILKLPWIFNNFVYGAIGNKLFKLISSCNECLPTVLDYPLEDYVLKKNTSWLSDVMQTQSKEYYLLLMKINLFLLIE